MNLLINEPPRTVEIGGEIYAINTDFRASIRFELMMQDSDLEPKDRLNQALKIYYRKNIPYYLRPEACEKILWFYRCGADTKISERDEEDSESESHVNKVYSFEHDADYIYAAFMGQYGIDLSKEKIHWWIFRALFKSLSEDCEFVKIMGYRSIKITSKMSKEQKAFYRKMKAIHALPLSEKDQKYQDALTDALMHGGDLTGVL